MKKTIKIVPLILLIICSYFLIFFKNISNYLDKYYYLLVILGIINWVVAINTNSEDYYFLATWGMIAKILLIPFYILNFIYWAFYMFFSTLTFIGFITIPYFSIIYFLADILVLIAVSSFGVSALFKSKKQEVINHKFFLTNFIFHFLFVFDVISSIIVFIKLKPKKS